MKQQGHAPLTPACRGDIGSPYVSSMILRGRRVVLVPASSSTTTTTTSKDLSSLWCWHAAAWIGGRSRRSSQQTDSRGRWLTTRIYAVGEGWTGALGTGRIDQTIQGHFDVEEQEDADLPVPMELPPTRSSTNQQEQASTTVVRSVSVGWGHTAAILQTTMPDDATTTNTENKNLHHQLLPPLQSQLFVTGRSQEFSSLLRLRRLPHWLRQYAVQQTLRNTEESLDDVSTRIDPASLITRLTSYLSETLDHSDGNTTTEHAAQSHQSFLRRFTAMDDFPNDQVPQTVVCSAGFSAILTESGHLYTFGLNAYGQCGTGQVNNNVWTPQRVTGLNSEFANMPRQSMEQSYPIVSVALGLQHGLCLNDRGEMFAFGKGDHGQLGQAIAMEESHTALPIRKACELINDDDDDNPGGGKPMYIPLGRIQQIAAGMLHCAALTENNQVLLWGKYILNKVHGDNPRAAAADARLPILLRGLPSGLAIVQLACGSHHTAFLLEDGSVWGVGISTDTKEPMHTPVCLIPPGLIELPVRQFTAHMDRTTIVGKDGRQVLQVHLWKDPSLQEYAMFTPAWVERLLEDDPQRTIQQIHRSWIHSVVVTSE